ncbi:MAG TPA: FmdC precursor, partial [Cytophagales bacterium]|nr:FmdC precursor [Cytophagales bacterium]
ESIFIDAYFKYNGISSLVEYANKKSPDGAVILDGGGNFVEAFYTGSGISWQAGYLFKNNFEIAGRYTHVSPEKITLRNENTQYTLGFSRYIVGHNLKIQSDITLIQEDTRDDQLMTRFQIELAF